MSGSVGARALNVTIGAALGASFKTSFATAARTTRDLGSAMRALDMQARSVDGLKRAEQAVNATALAWKRAEERVRDLSKSFGDAAAPTKRQSAELGRAEKAAKKAESALAALNAAMSRPPPVSAGRARSLAQTEAAAASARAEVARLNAAISKPTAPSPGQVERLGRVQAAAGAAAEKVRVLEAAFARGGAATTADRQAAALDKARARAAALEAKARDVAAAMASVRAPTDAQSAALAKAEARLTGLVGKADALRAAMAAVPDPMPKQIVQADKLKAALDQATGKADALRTTLANQKVNPDQARELARAAAEARNLKAAHEGATAALERQRRSASAIGTDVRNLAGETNRLGAAWRRATLDLDHFNATAARRAKIGDLAREMAGQGIAAAGLGRSLAASVRPAASFEHALARYGVVADVSGEKLEAVREQILSLSRSTNQTAPAMMEGLQTLVGRGMKEEDATRAIGAIGDAATATGASIEDLSKTAFSIVGNMGVEAGRLPKVFDMLAQSAKEGGVEVRDMARYFPMLTAHAQALEMTGTRGIASLSSALQVALKGAADPEGAARNFENFLAKLSSKETLQNFRKLGVDLTKEMATAAERGVNPIERVFNVLQGVIGDKTGPEAAAKLGEIFSDMQVGDFIRPLLANLQEYKRQRIAVATAEGVIARDKARMLATLQENMDGTANAVWRLEEALGRAITPVLAPLDSAFATVTDGATKLVNRLPGLAAGAVIVGGAFSVFRTALTGLRLGAAVMGLSALGKGLAVVSRVTGLGAIAGGISAIGGALPLLVSPLGLAVAAGVGLGAAGAAVYRNWSAVSDFFSGMGTVLATWSGTVGGVVLGAIKGMYDGFVRLSGLDPVSGWVGKFQRFADFITPLWGGIRDFIGGALDWIKAKIDVVGDAMRSFTDSIARGFGVVDEAWSKLVGRVTGHEAVPAIPAPERGAPTASDPSGTGQAARAQARNEQAGRNQISRRGVARIGEEAWAAVPGSDRPGFSEADSASIANPQPMPPLVGATQQAPARPGPQSIGATQRPATAEPDPKRSTAGTGPKPQEPAAVAPAANPIGATQRPATPAPAPLATPAAPPAAGRVPALPATSTAPPARLGPVAPVAPPPNLGPVALALPEAGQLGDAMRGLGAEMRALAVAWRLVATPPARGTAADNLPPAGVPSVAAPAPKPASVPDLGATLRPVPTRLAAPPVVAQPPVGSAPVALPTVSQLQPQPAPASAAGPLNAAAPIGTVQALPPVVFGAPMPSPAGALRLPGEPGAAGASAVAPALPAPVAIGGPIAVAAPAVMVKAPSPVAAVQPQPASPAPAPAAPEQPGQPGQHGAAGPAGAPAIVPPFPAPPVVIGGAVNVAAPVVNLAPMPIPAAPGALAAQSQPAPTFASLPAPVSTPAPVIAPVSAPAPVITPVFRPAIDVAITLPPPPVAAAPAMAFAPQITGPSAPAAAAAPVTVQAPPAAPGPAVVVPAPLVRPVFQPMIAVQVAQPPTEKRDGEDGQADAARPVSVNVTTQPGPAPARERPQRIPAAAAPTAPATPLFQPIAFTVPRPVAMPVPVASPIAPVPAPAARPALGGVAVSSSVQAGPVPVASAPHAASTGPAVGALAGREGVSVPSAIPTPMAAPAPVLVPPVVVPPMPTVSVDAPSLSGTAAMPSPVSNIIPFPAPASVPADSEAPAPRADIAATTPTIAAAPLAPAPSAFPLIQPPVSGDAPAQYRSDAAPSGSNAGSDLSQPRAPAIGGVGSLIARIFGRKRAAPPAADAGAPSASIAAPRPVTSFLDLPGAAAPQIRTPAPFRPLTDSIDRWRGGKPSAAEGIRPVPLPRSAPGRMGAFTLPAAAVVSPDATPRPELTDAQRAVAPEGSAERAMMDAVGKSEGTDKGRSYNETLGFGRYTGGAVDLTSMTLREVDGLQRRMLAHPDNRWNSSAVGRYQIVGSTMRGLVSEMGLDPATTKFTPEVQDAMFRHLANRRGLEDYKAGRIGADQLQNRIAQEWASAPRADTGRGHYAGQNVGISSQELRAAFNGVSPAPLGKQRAPAQTVGSAVAQAPYIAPVPAGPGRSPGEVLAAAVPSPTAMLQTVSAPPRAADADDGGAVIGSAVAANDGGSAVGAAASQGPVVGRTQMDAPPANDNTDRPLVQAVGESPGMGRGPDPIAALTAPGMDGAAGSGGAAVQSGADGAAEESRSGGAEAVKGPGFMGTLSMPINVTVHANGGGDPHEIARIARSEVEKAARQQIGKLRRGMYD